GKLYKLPYVVLFSILAAVTGGNSYRSIETVIDVHRSRLNAAFGLNWKRAPAHTAIRYILQRLWNHVVVGASRQSIQRTGLIVKVFRNKELDMAFAPFSRNSSFWRPADA